MCVYVWLEQPSQLTLGGGRSIVTSAAASSAPPKWQRGPARWVVVPALGPAQDKTSFSVRFALAVASSSHLPPNGRIRSPKDSGGPARRNRPSGFGSGSTQRARIHVQRQGRGPSAGQAPASTTSVSGMTAERSGVSVPSARRLCSGTDGLLLET